MVEDRRQTVVQPPNNLPYLVAVVAMMLLGVVGIVGITLARPEDDNGNLIGMVLGFLAPTTLSLLAFMKAQETHLSVNSRLDAFMASAKLAARAEGAAEGWKEGRDQANQRTDALSNIAAPVQVEVINEPLLVESGSSPSVARSSVGKSSVGKSSVGKTSSVTKTLEQIEVNTEETAKNTAKTDIAMQELKDDRT